MIFRGDNDGLKGADFCRENWRVFVTGEPFPGRKTRDGRSGVAGGYKSSLCQFCFFGAAAATIEDLRDGEAILTQISGCGDRH